MVHSLTPLIKSGAAARQRPQQRIRYLNHTRITKACTLLRMTDESILTVGEQVGFRSMSSFNRHFAEAMGCSPSEWRRTVGAGRSTSILKYNGWLTPPRDK